MWTAYAASALLSPEAAPSTASRACPFADNWRPPVANPPICPDLLPPTDINQGARPTIILEPTETLYHGGQLVNGEVQPGRPFFVTSDPDYAAAWAQYHGGSVNTFEVPTHVLMELEDAGIARTINDSMTDIIKVNMVNAVSSGKGWRFTGQAASTLNKYRR